MNSYPFLTLKQALFLLRVSVALVFFLHAVVRVANGTIEQFAEFLSSKGIGYGTPVVWCITGYEILGSIVLAFGYFIKILSAGFILILLVGVVLIHASLGWFVGEHGTGGSEYSFILIIALVVIAAGTTKQNSDTGKDD